MKFTHLVIFTFLPAAYRIYQFSYSVCALKEFMPERPLSAEDIFNLLLRWHQFISVVRLLFQKINKSI